MVYLSFLRLILDSPNVQQQPQIDFEALLERFCTVHYRHQAYYQAGWTSSCFCSNDLATSKKNEAILTGVDSTKEFTHTVENQEEDLEDPKNSDFMKDS